MVEIVDGGLAFDDVLLVPKKSDVQSRKGIDTTSQLTRKIKLAIPIVSANMDTVTESSMAIAMARAGGIGIVHRFMPVQEQVEEVLRVKRAESIVIEQPYTLTYNKTVKDAKEIMKKYSISGVLVVDHHGKLVGIVTRKDVAFENNGEEKISEAMTQKENLVTAKSGISVEEAEKILHEHKIEKLPLVDENGYLKGLITAKDILQMKNFPKASKDSKGRLLVGAAIGVKDGYMERAEALIRAGADVLVVDIAHGHSDLALTIIKNIRGSFQNVELIAGNVATAEGTKDLIEAGADAVKVGVGSGSICITRIVTGSGVPQLTAIINCAKTAKDYGLTTIADGGIRNSGDITKALAAGASTVMLGGLLAGTDESPGTTVMRNGRKYKLVRGMASVAANVDRRGREGNSTEENLLDYVPEGVEAFVPHKGSAIEIINQLVGGLRSGMSYCGAKDLLSLQKNSQFIKMSSAGLRESMPHDVEIM